MHGSLHSSVLRALVVILETRRKHIIEVGKSQFMELCRGHAVLNASIVCAVQTGQTHGYLMSNLLPELS